MCRELCKTLREGGFGLLSVSETQNSFNNSEPESLILAKGKKNCLTQLSREMGQQVPH